MGETPLALASPWQTYPESPIPLSDPNALIFKQKDAYLLLTQQAYNECLHWGDVAIAMAGTATEQFIGLGKPAIAIPGGGPQYNPAFAEAQSRLLGPSLILVEQPSEVATVLPSLLKNPVRSSDSVAIATQKSGRFATNCRKRSAANG